MDAFELWCWRRLLRVPWVERKSNQSILKEIRSGCSLKDWCWSWNSSFWRADSFEKTLMLGKIEDRRRRGWQRMRWLDGTSDPMVTSLGKLWELVMDREVWRAAVQWGSQRVRRDRATELNWTEQKNKCCSRTLKEPWCWKSDLYCEQCFEIHELTHSITPIILVVPSVKYVVKSSSFVV